MTNAQTNSWNNEHINHEEKQNKRIISTTPIVFILQFTALSFIVLGIACLVSGLGVTLTLLTVISGSFLTAFAQILSANIDTANSSREAAINTKKSADNTKAILETLKNK